MKALYLSTLLALTLCACHEDDLNSSEVAIDIEGSWVSNCGPVTSGASSGTCKSSNQGADAEECTTEPVVVDTWAIATLNFTAGETHPRLTELINEDGSLNVQIQLFSDGSCIDLLSESPSIEGLYKLGDVITNKQGYDVTELDIILEDQGLDNRSEIDKSVIYRQSDNLYIGISGIAPPARSTELNFDLWLSLVPE